MMGSTRMVRMKLPQINVRKQNPVASLRHAILRSSFFSMMLKPFEYGLSEGSINFTARMAEVL
jgi:hypothetical protein